MANLLDALFCSKERYLTKCVDKQNRMKAFPIYNHWTYRDFVEASHFHSVVISGNDDEERAFLILKLILRDGRRKVVLHNGNQFLAPDYLRENGINVRNWDEVLSTPVDKRQLLTTLSGENMEEGVACFFSFAIEVLYQLKLPITFMSIAKIDWTGMDWQYELLEKADNDEALDLIARYDKDMAKNAVRASCYIERIVRSQNRYVISNQPLTKIEDVYIKNINGNHLVAKQCMEILADVLERGEEVLLVLDDVYIQHPLIQENVQKLRLILSASDLCKVNKELDITRRPCDYVVFRHNNAESAKVLAKELFGEYDKLMTTFGLGVGRENTSLIRQQQNSNISVHEQRDMRLKPEWIGRLDHGKAFIRTIGAEEGILDLNTIR